MHTPAAPGPPAAPEPALEVAERLAHVGSWEWDVESGALAWSAEVFRIFGVDPDSFRPTYAGFLERVDPRDRRAVETAAAQALTDASSYQVEHRLVRPDGARATVIERGEVRRRDDGGHTKLVGAIVDVTEERLGLRREHALMEIAHLALEDVDEPTLLAGAVALVAEALELEHAEILGPAEGGVRVIRAAAGRPHEPVGRTIADGDPYAGLTADVTAPLLIEEPAGEGDERLVGGAAVALPSGEGSIGVLVVHTKTMRAFAPGELEFLQTVAYVIASGMLRRRDADDLRRRNAYLSLVVGSVPAVLTVVDRDLRYTLSEGKGLELLGLGRAGLVGRAVTDYFKGESAGLVSANYRRALAGETLGYEHEWAGRVWRVRYEPLVEADTVVGAIGLAVDVSDLKRLEDELRERTERLERLIDSSALSVIVVDLSGTVELWNAAAEAMFGWTAAEVVGGPYPLLADERQFDEFRAHLREVEAGVRFLRNIERRRKDGRPIYLRGGAAPLHGPDGSVTGAIGVYADISEQREAEEALRRLNVELEARVRGRTSQLEAANKELESFSYSVSHDLRAPLRAIDGFSQALVEDYRELVDDRGRDYIARIRTATQRMGTLIDDMLKLSGVSRAELRLEPVDLSRIASELLRHWRAAEPQRQVEVAVEPGLTATGDGDLIRVLLENLLHNAWKFSSTRERAAIEVGRDAATGAFYVRDDGVGFDPNYAGKLFTPFHRLHSIDEFPGTGIGLATVQRIVHRHGGRVWAEGRPGQGATFHFTLAEER